MIEGSVGNKHFIDKWDNGNLKLELYYFCGNLTRDNGPAMIEYNQSGTLIRETYYYCGRVHRADGPARIEYTELERIEDYYLDGRLIHVPNIFFTYEVSEVVNKFFTDYVNCDRYIFGHDSRTGLPLLTKLILSSIKKFIDRSNNKEDCVAEIITDLAKKDKDTLTLVFETLCECVPKMRNVELLIELI